MARKLFVKEAHCIDQFCLKILFSDGIEKIVDFEPFLINHPHPQYDKYRDPKLFASFKIEHGNIVWGENWDLIFPVEQLHSGKIE